MQTIYCRDQNGWNAKTVIEIDDGRQLHIRTARRLYGSPGLETRATVWSPWTKGSLSHKTILFGKGGDFARNLAVSHPKRVTEKVVIAQHVQALGLVDQLRAEASAYYQQLPPSAVF